METFRAFLVLIGIVSGILCFSFGNQEIKDSIEQITANPSHKEYQERRTNHTKDYQKNVYAVTSHSGINGGAIGFGFISGMCFIAVAITFIGREEKIIKNGI